MKNVLLFILLPVLAIAQQRTYQRITDTAKARVLQIDQLSLDASVAFDVPDRRVDSHVKITFQSLTEGLDSLWLDGPGIEITSLLLDDTDAHYQIYPDGLAIFPSNYFAQNQTYQLAISYHAWPKKGLYFVGWEDKTNLAPKQIWTQGQGIDHRHWLPHVDAQNDKLITSLTVTFDTGYTVISNGLLAGVETRDSVNVWHYTMTEPHSSYLIMLAIGKYDSFIEKSESGFNLTNYYYPEWADRNKYTYYQSTSVFNFLEKEIGVPYPWQDYKQVPVMNFQHGAMENTTATIFGDFFCVDSISFNDRNYVGVNAHELAHQWFGNLVTATHSTHHWLHEGFASYYTWLAEREVFGEDRFALLRKESLERVLAAEERDMFPLAHGQAGSERFYDKGAWVLFMLRKSIGDKAWECGIKDYLTKNAFGMATTETFKQSMEYGCSCNLDRFFEQWIYRPQLPKLNMRVEESDGQVHILVEQDLPPGQPFYSLHVPLKLITSKGERNNTLVFEDEFASLSLSLDKKERLMAVIPDPNFELLATWTIDAPLFVVENAAANQQSNWYAAASALPLLEDYNPKIAGFVPLASLLGRVAFAEGVGKRANTNIRLDSEEINFLRAEKSLEVIKAFLKQSPALQPEMRPVAEKWLALPSYDLVELTLIRLCISDKANAMRYLEKTKNIVGTSGHNVRITWLLLYSAFVSQDKTSELTEYMSAKFDFLTRIKAFEAAQQLNLVNYTVANHAFGSLLQGNRKLRSAGRDFIKTMSAQPKNKEVFQGWINRNRQILSPDELKIIEQLTGYKPNN
jgi:aminopeptidase N